MAEPDTIVLEHLRGIRAQIEQLDRKVDRVQIGVAGFGLVVHEPDALKERVGRLESERA